SVSETTIELLPPGLTTLEVIVIKVAEVFVAVIPKNLNFAWSSADNATCFVFVTDGLFIRSTRLSKNAEAEASTRTFPGVAPIAFTDVKTIPAIVIVCVSTATPVEVSSQDVAIDRLA